MMKLLPVLVLSAVIAAVLSTDLRALYRETQAKYSSSVPIVSSSPEESKQHFAEFCQFAQDVAKHNAEDPNGYTAEINMFALMVSANKLTRDLLST